MGLSGTLAVAANIRYTPDTGPDLSPPVVYQLAETIARTLTVGAGADQANRLWTDQRTVAASTNDDLDLAGVLADVFGQTLSSARVKALILEHVSGTNELTIGGSPLNPWISWLAASGDGVKLTPSGGLIALFAPSATGYPVTAGSADVLRVANGAGSSVTYKIIIVGSTT